MYILVFYSVLKEPVSFFLFLLSIKDLILTVFLFHTNFIISFVFFILRFHCTFPGASSDAVWH